MVHRRWGDRSLSNQLAAGPTVLGERVVANLGLLMMTFTWGAFFPILERLLVRWDVYSATLGRQILGTVVLFAFVTTARQPFPLPSLIPWKRILLLGGIGVAIGSLLTSFGVLFSSGLSSAIVSTTNPVGAALTATALYREPLGRGMLLGTFLSVVGGVITVMGSQSLEHAQFRGGEILIILANVAWTWMSMAAQCWLRGFTQLQIAAFTVGAGALWLLLLLPVIAISNVVNLRVDFSVEALGMVAFAGILPIAVGNFFWHYGVSRVGIVVASMYNNLLPAAALAITVLLGGAFTWLQLAGSIVILAGVLTAQLLAVGRRF
jgi:drug/metabolite transporter (DMT)-like permease